MKRCDTLGAAGHGAGTHPAAPSTGSVCLSKGHPAARQGWTTEAGDSRVWAAPLLTLLQQLKMRMEGASRGHVGFIEGRRDGKRELCLMFLIQTLGGGRIVWCSITSSSAAIISASCWYPSAL